MTQQILWDTRITVISKKYRALNTYIGKKKDLKINNLNSHLREPEIEEQMKPKAIRRKEQKFEQKSIKLKTRYQLEKINKTKS